MNKGNNFFTHFITTICCTIIAVVVSLRVWLSDPITQEGRRQTHRQQARTFDVSLQWLDTLVFWLSAFVGLIIAIIILWCTGYAALRLYRFLIRVRLEFNAIQLERKHELDLKSLDVQAIKYQATASHIYTGLENLNLRDSHDVSFTQHTRQSHALKSSSEQITPAHIDIPTDNPLVRQLPSLSQILYFNKDNPKQICYGIDEDSKPRVADLKSSYIVGLSGGGKSSLTAFLMYQLLYQATPAQLIICDSHKFNSESLTNRLGLDLARTYETQKECLKAIARTLEIFELRRQGRASHDRPVIFCVDEWLSMLRSEELAKAGKRLVDVLVQEGRKFNMFVFIAGQAATVKQATDVIKLMHQKIILKMTLSTARTATDLPSEFVPRDTLQLPAGGYYLIDFDTGLPQKLVTPEVNSKNIITLHPSFKSNIVEEGNTQINEPNIDIQVKSGIAEEDDRIIELYAADYDFAQIVQMVYSEGGKKVTGTKYQDKLKHVNAVIRALMKSKETAA